MSAPESWSAHIERALATEGGHLTIGRYGYSLYFGRSCSLSGYDLDDMKAACIAAGLPVIDSRSADIEKVATVVIRGPMVAVGETPSAPPWHALSYTPLQHVAELYRAVGADVHNLPPVSTDTPREVEDAAGG